MNNYFNSFEFSGHIYYYFDLEKLAEEFPSLKRLPYYLKILFEANLRNNQDNINSLVKQFSNRLLNSNINIYTSRVISEEQDGLSTLVDLASYRENFKDDEKILKRINPQLMFDFISNENRFHSKFIKWSSKQFKNLTVIPLNDSLSKNINLEFLSTMIFMKKLDEKIFLFPELVLGVDEQTSTINALGVLGYKTNSLQMQLAVLGENITIAIPKVMGIEIKGSFALGVGLDDLILYLAALLKDRRVENSIIEFYGDSLKHLLVEDRAQICRELSKLTTNQFYFPIDENTISYVEQTRGVDVSLIKEYYKRQNLLLKKQNLEYDENIVLDLSLVKAVANEFNKIHERLYIKKISSSLFSYKKGNFIKDNDIVVSIISSTSSITQLIQAGLLAKKAIEIGLNINSNIKRVLKIDSKLHLEILKKIGFLESFEKLGYEINSNNLELIERVVLDIEKFNLNVNLLANNRYLTKQFNSLIKLQWQISPALNIAYCLKGDMNFDITSQALCADIYLSDIWPSIVEVNECIQKIDSSIYNIFYKDVLQGSQNWQNIAYQDKLVFNWEEKSTHIQASHFFDKNSYENININNGKILALFGDEISTEMIIPNGNILPYSKAAIYLQQKGLRPDEFDTFESRFGDYEFMSRGVFSNIELKNRIVHPKEGGYTKDFDSFEIVPIYDFCQKMKEENRELIIFAGKNFGVGVFKEWACKGIKALGVKAIIANSFNEEYRLGLISLGIIPFEFIDEDISSLNLKGDEYISIKIDDIKPQMKLSVKFSRANELKSFEVVLRLDSFDELRNYKEGGTISKQVKNFK